MLAATSISSSPSSSPVSQPHTETAVATDQGIKGCLVHRNSLTSDEDANLEPSDGQVAIHGILKSREASRDVSLSEAGSPVSGQHCSRSALYESTKSSKGSSNNFTPIAGESTIRSHFNKMGLRSTLPFTDHNHTYEGNCPKTVKPRIGTGGGSVKKMGAIVTLVVDDTRFTVDPDMFRQHSNTMLGRMFR